jgi:YVTN family beta-propeller protein
MNRSTKSMFPNLVVVAILLLIVSVKANGGGSIFDGNMVLITNWADDTVSLVDIEQEKELATIKVGAKPYDIKIDAAGRFAYVTNSAASDISVIDIQAMLESHRIPTGTSPRDILLSKDGKWLVTANSGDGTISKIDIASRKELFKVKVGAIPYGVAFSDDEKTALITNWGENTLSVVDLTSQKEIKKIPIGSLPYTVVVPAGQKFANVSSFGSHSILRINLNTFKVDTMPVGRSPWGLATSDNGKILAAANFSSNEISILDAVNFTEKARIKLLMPTNAAAGAGITAKPKNLAVNREGTGVVFSDLANNSINALDVSTGKVVKTIKVGKAPYGIAFLPRK